MDESPSPERSADSADKPGFLDRLFGKITSEAPESTGEIAKILKEARAAGVIDPETWALMNNALGFPALEVRDSMVPRSQMQVVRRDADLQSIVSLVMETAHSRFPVIGDDKDEVLGILHAKDLLNFFGQPQAFDLKGIMRPAEFVPESKPLIDMARDFRARHFHLAVVVDEFGGVSGVITFEDVIEQLVGEIEDEFDWEAEGSEEEIAPMPDGRYRVEATTYIEDLNEKLGTDFSDDEVDTVGGLVVTQMGRMPKRGERLAIDGWVFTVARADRRRVHTLIMQPPGSDGQESPEGRGQKD